VGRKIFVIDFYTANILGCLKDYALQKMMSFTKKKNMKFYQVHTSGHAEIDTLKKVL